MTRNNDRKLGRLRPRERDDALFQIAAEDITTVIKRVMWAEAAGVMEEITESQLMEFRARYSTFITENSWKYASPRFQQTLPDMLRKEGTMTEDSESEYLKVIEVYARRTGKDTNFDVLRLPSHYAILRILGCVR